MGTVDPKGALSVIGQLTTRPQRIALMGNSIVRQTALRMGTAATLAWTAGATAALNAVAGPKFDDLTAGVNAIKWVCTQAGVTGTTEPPWKWGDAVGTTYVDGTAIWTAQAETSTPWASWSVGWWTYAQARTGQRYQEVCFNGRSGEKAGAILAYFDRAMACSPDIMFFGPMWENNATVGPNLAETQADWNLFLLKADAARAAGKQVWVATVLPSGFTDVTNPLVPFVGYTSGVGTKIVTWLNRKIKEFAAARSDVVLVPWDRTYVDNNIANPMWPENTTTFTSSAGAGQGLKRTDGVHPAKCAGWQLSGVVASVINSISRPVDHFGVVTDDNTITTNPLGFGTAGTRNATIGSGTVPNGLSADAFGGTAGSTSVAQVPRTDAATGNWTRITAVAAAAASGDGLSVSFTTNSALGSFAVGDLVQGYFEQRVLANPVLFTDSVCRLRFASAASQWVYSHFYATTDQDLASQITSDTTLVWKTPPVFIPSGTIGINQFNRADWRGAASITADFGQMNVKRVVPRDLA